MNRDPIPGNGHLIRELARARRTSRSPGRPSPASLFLLAEGERAERAATEAVLRSIGIKPRDMEETP